MENSSRLSSIGLVLPYFGTFPNYFPLFLESCRKNPTVDWHIYTDSTVDYDYPDNVIVHRLTFGEFQARLQKSFDFPITLKSPYKLCDFKPTYGETLAEDLKDYDFWGHCDCDMIYGNIRRFITEDVLSRYDRILNNGHTILYRNIPEVNSYYRTQSYIDHKAILTDSKNHSFDEWPGLSECWRRDGKASFDHLCFDDILIMADDFRPVQVLPGGFVGPYHGQPSQAGRFSRMRNITYRFQDGTLERCWVQSGKIHTEEVMYVHFQKRKMQITEGISMDNLNSFFIIPNAFLAPVDLAPEALRALAPQSYSKATVKAFLVFWAMILKREVSCIGQPNYRSCSVILNLLKH